MDGEKGTLPLPLPAHGLAAAAPVPPAPVDAVESESHKCDRTGTYEKTPKQGDDSGADGDGSVEPAGGTRDGQEEQADAPKPQQAGVATFFVCAPRRDTCSIFNMCGS
jgi:hypothetical protein